MAAFLRFELPSRWPEYFVLTGTRDTRLERAIGLLDLPPPRLPLLSARSKTLYKK